jgi:hypothetical protein
MKKYTQLITYLLATTSYQGHSSRGERMNVCLSVESARIIHELSLILGKMQVYTDKEDSENLGYMLKHFELKCEEYDIDLDHFESWYEDNSEEDECEDENDCETC